MNGFNRWAALSAFLTFGLPSVVTAADLHVMKTGLGDGVISGTGISCGITAGTVSSDCDETGTTSITLNVTVGAGAQFTSWGGDCASVAVVPPATPSCLVPMDAVRRVRANFDLTTPITPIATFTPEGIRTYLAAHTEVDTPAEFLAALPVEFKRNWILMVRSESLQTGIASLPRFLLPSADATRVFTFGLSPSHASYPGAHPSAIEYMQWDVTEKNFRFHEIIVVPPGAANAIPAMGHDLDPGPGVRLPFGPRERGVTADDQKCFACHSTRNVINLNPARDGPGTTPGTTGITPQTIKFKNKPNWDTYDSWGGQLAFNRDRIYKGSVDAAAFRKLFNLWTWQGNDSVRAFVEQLELQPPNVPNGSTIPQTSGVPDHRIRRDVFIGGENDGHIVFGFDPAAAVTVEPTPDGTVTAAHSNYEFNEAAGTGTASDVVKNGSFLTLHHSLQVTSDEGRGVELFDRLTTGPNPLRIADELIPKPPLTDHFATGNVAIDVRPLAIAVADSCLNVAGGTDPGSTQTITGMSAALAAQVAFFNARNGLTFDQVYDDTRRRAQSLTRRKADIERRTLDRDEDVYVYDPDPFDGVPIAPPDRVNGLIREYGAFTSGITGGSGGLDLSFPRLRQEVFRRAPPPGHLDETVLGRIYVDREDDSTDFSGDNTARMALFRYFLEPLGVSVDKWSMGVRGRSRTYTFADLLGSVTSPISSTLKPTVGLSGANCATIMAAVDTQIARLPAAAAAPTYTDIQRIFNKSCIECHGGLSYPPYHTYGTFLDFTENENPVATDPFPANRRLGRSYALASSLTAAPTGAGTSCTDFVNSYIFDRITDGCNFAHPYNPGIDPNISDERCPNGVMPCGGPPLSKTDIETVKRWIKGATPPAYSEGDPHIKTVEDVNYDFQSAGEFVLLRDEGMELQTRQTAVTTAGPLGPNAYTGLSSCVSVNTAVALRVGGHRVTYQPEIKGRGDGEPTAASGQRRLILRIDGKPATLAGGEIALSRGGRVKRAPEPDSIQIEVPGGTRVVITPRWWSTHQIWFMQINTRHVRAVEGVMGVIAPGNWLPALSNGDQLGPRPSDLAQRHQQLYEKFADSWRVDDASSLFDYEAGLSSSSFVVADWPVSAPQGCLAPPQPGGPASVPAPAPIAQADAERHCAAITTADRRGNCVQDVMATGEAGFAEAYLASERLEQRKAPPATVLVFPADSDRVSPAKVKFEWATAPGAGEIRVSYRHCVWNADEMFDLNRCNKLGGAGSLADVLPPGLAKYLTPHACMTIFIVLIVVLILIVLVLILRIGRRRLLPVLMLAAIILAILLAFCRMGARAPLKTSVAALQPGKVYFWKVVTETPDGITVESRTQRFEVTH